MIRRWLMRRAYNLGQWEVAKQHAQLLLTKPNEMKLSRSVYIRSCWHLNSFEEVVNLNAKWNNGFEELAGRSRYKLAQIEGNMEVFDPKIQRLHEEHPRPYRTKCQWNKSNMVSNFF